MAKQDTIAKRKGRVITPKGKSFIDKLAIQIEKHAKKEPGIAAKENTLEKAQIKKDKSDKEAKDVPAPGTSEQAPLVAGKEKNIQKPETETKKVPENE